MKILKIIYWPTHLKTRMLTDSNTVEIWIRNYFFIMVSSEQQL